MYNNLCHLLPKRDLNPRVILCFQLVALNKQNMLSNSTYHKNGCRFCFLFIIPCLKLTQLWIDWKIGIYEKIRWPSFIGWFCLQIRSCGHGGLRWYISIIGISCGWFLTFFVFSMYFIGFQEMWSTYFHYHIYGSVKIKNISKHGDQSSPFAIKIKP